MGIYFSLDNYDPIEFVLRPVLIASISPMYTFIFRRKFVKTIVSVKIVISLKRKKKRKKKKRKNEEDKHSEFRNLTMFRFRVSRV